jgi:MarR family 2-MHQ and catechol resistance regulon transcriptional repressor
MPSPESPSFHVAGRVGLALNLDEHTRYTLMRTGARLFREADPFYRSLGLTGLQYNVLRVLEAVKEELPQQEVARQILASRANVTHLLDQLEAKGLVERCPCQDRRVKLIRITDKALALLKKTFPDILEISTKLVENITDDEKRTLLRLIEKLEGIE